MIVHLCSYPNTIYKKKRKKDATLIDTCARKVVCPDGLLSCIRKKKKKRRRSRERDASRPIKASIFACGCYSVMLYYVASRALVARRSLLEPEVRIGFLQQNR